MRQLNSANRMLAFPRVLLLLPLLLLLDHLPLKCAYGQSFTLEDMAQHARTTWIRAKRAEALSDQLAATKERQSSLQLDGAPSFPTLPSTFKAKGKATLRYEFDSKDDRDLLAIYHYDHPSRKTRMDVYFVNQENVTRYFTDIRDYNEQQKFMIFHQIRGTELALKSPHTCLITPLKNAMLHPRVIHNDGTWMGDQNTTVGQGNVSFTVPTHLWEIEDDDGSTWHYYESLTRREPVRLSRHEKNIDIHFLDFQATDVHPPGMFAPERVSKVPCNHYRSRNAHSFYRI